MSIISQFKKGKFKSISTIKQGDIKYMNAQSSFMDFPPKTVFGRILFCWLTFLSVTDNS